MVEKARSHDWNTKNWRVNITKRNDVRAIQQACLYECIVESKRNNVKKKLEQLWNRDTRHQVLLLVFKTL